MDQHQIDESTSDRGSAAVRKWVATAVRVIEADTQRSADTHLLRFPLPAALGVDLYLKDESTHVTGSLKHRLARSLFLHALCSGSIEPSTTIIEASSGSTAVSEAYFARLIGVPFVAVMPANTSPAKIDLIRRQGGRCHLVDDPSTVYTVAQGLADKCDGHYLDQFTNAERATDWRGNNNIAESIFAQLSREQHPVPEWIVAAAGTGGTSATIGRYVRYCGYPTRLCVPDPEGSAFFDAWTKRDIHATGLGSQIEGVGRPRVEPSFIAGVIDRMTVVPNAYSVATMRAVESWLGRRVGASTGTNLWTAFGLIAEMARTGRRGSVVTLLCDGGERYNATYYDDEWVARRGWDLEAPTETIREFLTSGNWRDF